MAKGGLAFNEISLRSRENDRRRFVIIFHPILFDLLSEVGNQRRESQRFQEKATPHWFLAVTIQGRFWSKERYVVTYCPLITCALVNLMEALFSSSNHHPNLAEHHFGRILMNETTTRRPTRKEEQERENWMGWVISVNYTGTISAAFIVCIIIYFASNIAVGKIYQP